MSIEILSPAGNMEKLKTAVYFGADAVYFSGKNFGLRAFAGNFSEEEIAFAVQFCHEKNVKAYVTVNIVAHNKDFENLKEYLQCLEKLKVDGIIISDLGVMSFVKDYAPKLHIHVSTQANVTNKFSAKFLADFGVKRIVLARELTLSEIREIREFLPKDVELEAFVHGAMCISYSGRCLLSNYLANRPSNNGQCIQACRWEYTINQVSRANQKLPIEEDERGTYILNSKDLKMIEHLGELREAGVTSFKIEGRMKSPYYVATVTNAYVRAKKLLESGEKFDCPKELVNELEKTSHRDYTTGFSFKDKMKEESENIFSSQPVQSFEFVAIVLENAKKGKVLVEMRNRFAVSDTLEVLSPSNNFNKKIVVTGIENFKGEELQEAIHVQEKLFLKTSLNLHAGDILRKENTEIVS